MSRWRYTLDCKSPLVPFRDRDDVTVEEIQQVTAQIKAECMKANVGVHERDEALKGMLNAKDLDEFNARFDELYDWADYHGVWMGV